MFRWYPGPLVQRGGDTWQGTVNEGLDCDDRRSPAPLDVVLSAEDDRGRYGAGIAVQGNSGLHGGARDGGKADSFARNNDALRECQVADGCNEPAEAPPGIFDHPHRRWIALFAEIQRLFVSHRPAEGFGDVPGNGV